eukprot:8294563-Alexandrium_andersonii.AAC.1
MKLPTAWHFKTDNVKCKPSPHMRQHGRRRGGIPVSGRRLLSCSEKPTHGLGIMKTTRCSVPEHAAENHGLAESLLWHKCLGPAIRLRSPTEIAVNTSKRTVRRGVPR